MCMYQWLLDLKNSITTIHTTGHSYATKSILRVKQWATLVPVLYKVRIPDHWYKNWSTHASVSMDAYVLAASTKVLWRENQIGLRMSLEWRWTKCLQEVQWVLSCTILTLRVPDHGYIKIFGCLFYTGFVHPQSPSYTLNAPGTRWKSENNRTIISGFAEYAFHTR